jgi:hypothetical protein
LSWWNPYTEPPRELRTKLTAAACRERLARRVAPWLAFGPSPERPLKGRVSASGFALYHFRAYRHGFETEARGRFEMDAVGTRVRVRFGFKLQDRIFFVFWIAFTIALAAFFGRLTRIAAGGHPPAWLDAFPLALAVLMNLILLIAFLIVRRQSRGDPTFLAGLIREELEATSLEMGGPIE